MKKNVRGSKTQKVRINSGKLRGRQLSFPDIDGLRPTLGRTRETLFNWLRPMLTDSTCLDLFAGSGVLGIEAASIGARQVVLLEQDRSTANHLSASLVNLGLADICTLWTGDACAWLQRCEESFDIIFVDPPFADTDLLKKAIRLIATRNLARQWIYIEFNQQQEEAMATLLAAHHLQPAKAAKAGATRSWLVAPANSPDLN